MLIRTIIILIGLFATSAQAEVGDLKAGVATRVVNPTRPAVPIGHSCKKLFSGVYSDICVQALVLEDSANKRSVIMSIDFCQAPAEVVDQIKAKVREKHGIDPKAFCINASHNHSSPPIIKREAAEQFDQEYVDFFVNQAVGAVGDALAKLAPVRLRYCEDLCTSVAINRRGKLPDGTLNIVPKNTGIVDFQVRVIAAESVADGKPIAIVTEYAAHPVTVVASGLGGEYPSFMRKFVEKRFPGATAMFLQGCAGNIRIRVLDEERTAWILGNPKMAEGFGKDLGEAVERALSHAGEPILGPIDAQYAEVALPIKRQDEPNTISLRIQAFRFGPNSKSPFTLVTLGAEAFSEYSLNLIQRLKPVRAMVIGYSNGCAAYLPTAKAIGEGGYEPAAWSEALYSLPGPYAPEAENIVLDAATQLALGKAFVDRK